jgi:phospholipid-translocating ATPase
MLLLELLSVCHTVQVNESLKQRYQASSPDEMCFVDFCSRLGIFYQGDKNDKQAQSKVREVNFQSKVMRYEILQILDFDATRKRMSIILRSLQTGKIILFCKGADSAIFKNTVAGDVQSCETAIRLFAHSGWRTLGLSYRELTESEYRSCEQLLTEAYNDIMDRGNKIAQAFETIESNLTLLGSTAIEDKLQENVAETIQSLRMCGIKIWVLTGDKLETAINISQSCNHFSDSMFKLKLTGLKNSNEIERALDDYLKK